MNEYKRQEGYSDDEEDAPVYHNDIQKTLWELFEKPKSSKAALVVALTSVSMTVVAIMILCLETLPRFRKYSCQIEVLIT